MGVAERVVLILKANLNDLLDRAEDPEKMVRQLLLEMNSHLIQVRTQTAVAMSDERRLKVRWQENATTASGWHARAEAAVAGGDDELAKQALARHNTYRQLAEGFEAQYEQQCRQVMELKDALSQLEMKIHAAEARRDLLITRNRRAKAELTVHRTMAENNGVSLLAEFDRMEAKVEEAELTSQAYRELDRDTLEVRFQQIEESANLDRQLAELKALVADTGSVGQP